MPDFFTRSPSEFERLNQQSLERYAESRNNIHKRNLMSTREKESRAEALRLVVADLRLSKTTRQQAIRELRPLERELGWGSTNYNEA